MPLIHFQERFADDVKSGKKRQTIRIERKRPIKPGDKLILGTWEGKPYRSKVRRLGEVVCKEVRDIVIFSNGEIRINGWPLSDLQRSMLAVDDGFSSAVEMVDWFEENHGLPFEGVVIRW
jgi:hypothetical protein